MSVVISTHPELALVFPGQGSQTVGMLAALAQRHPAITATFAEASAALDIDLWALAQQGPEAELNRTERTQPVLLAAGVAVFRAWRAAGGPVPGWMAGHSLGEYTALVCAGALPFADAVRLVAQRGRCMQQAVPADAGGMAAILGLADDAVRACCEAAEREGGVVAAVNFNAPGQVVIAGERAALERALARCKAAGAKRALPLPVSVPAHCALMRPAAECLRPALEATPWRTPASTVLHNADVAAHDDPAAMQDALLRQLYRPVRWVETVQALAAAGVRQIIECGPGAVLTGLNKRIDKTLSLHAIGEPEAFERALALTPWAAVAVADSDLKVHA